MYADGTVLYCLSPQAFVIQDKLNAELSKIDHWFSFNSLFVNATKTEAMLFETAPRLSAVNSFSITLNNNVIKRVFHFTYLGIVFDYHLSWLTRESTNVVYCSLIRPISEYCVTVWGCCGEDRKHDLEALQNRAARIVARTVYSKQAVDVLKSGA